jgi:hypothetical protein
MLLGLQKDQQGMSAHSSPTTFSNSMLAPFFNAGPISA